MVVSSFFGHPENFILNKLAGNGDGLVDVGLLSQDFGRNLIKESHLDGALVASRNIRPFVIKE